MTDTPTTDQERRDQETATKFKEAGKGMMALGCLGMILLLVLALVGFLIMSMCAG